MANGIEYSASFPATAITGAAQDIFLLTTSSDTPISVRRIEVTTNATTQASYEVRLVTRSTAGSGGNTTSVEVKATTQRITTAADTTLTKYVTTVGTVGNLLGAWNWNIVVPFDIDFLDSPIEIPAASYLALYIPASIGTPNVTARVTFIER